MEGRCTCQRIRYRLTSEPLFVHACHCTWCQRETGAAFALNAMIEASRVELLAGEPELVDTPSNSGKGQAIARCPTCRVALWSNYGGRGDIVRFVRVGTLEGARTVKPDVHIFTSTKQPWLDVGDAVPVCEEFYDRTQLWPEASLERWKVLMESRR